MLGKLIVKLLLVAALVAANSQAAVAQFEADNIHFSVIYQVPETYGQVIVSYEGHGIQNRAKSVVFLTSGKLREVWKHCEVSEQKAACLVQPPKNNWTYESVLVEFTQPVTDVCVRLTFEDSRLVERCDTFGSSEATPFPWPMPEVTSEVTPEQTAEVTPSPTVTVTVTPEPNATATETVVVTAEPSGEWTPFPVETEDPPVEQTAQPTSEPTSQPIETATATAEPILTATAPPLVPPTRTPTPEVTPQAPTAEDLVDQPLPRLQIHLPSLFRP